MFTPKQQRIYRPMVDRAWEAHRCRLPEATNKRSWYEQELYQAIGLTSTKNADHTHDFDQAMLHFATIAGADTAIARFSDAQRTRISWLIRDRLRAISSAQGYPATWPYAAAIYEQMSQSGRIPEDMDECPAELLYKVYQALDTHLRRHAKKHLATTT